MYARCCLISCLFSHQSFMQYCFVLVGFTWFYILFVFSCLGDLYLVLVLKFCFVLLLTRIKSKDITYTSGINEDVIIDLKAESCAVSMGWRQGMESQGLGVTSLTVASPRGAAPKGLAWGGQSWVLVTGSSTASGMAKDEPGSGNARGTCEMSGFMECWENWLKVRA